MRILVLGATGMLGHKLVQVLGHRFDVSGTVRGPAAVYADHPVLMTARLIGTVVAEEFDSVVQALAASRPAVVINCIGIVKQRPEAQDPLQSIRVNALFPHRLARLCQAAGARMVHISTDCVFSGQKGNYVEEDISDAEDLYGRTKYLGEVSDEGCLTLRTSIIGRELQTLYGLVEWFLGQQGRTIQGYKRAIFSGVTTQTLAEIIAEVIARRASLDGVWHVAAEPISKFRLLSLMREEYGLEVQIETDETVVCDRSLNGDRFRQTTGLVAPSWPEMIRQMHLDPTPYSEIRRSRARR